MPTVYERAIQQQQALLAGEKEVAGRLTAAYDVAERDLLARLKALTDLIDAKRANGEEPTPNWLFQQSRFQKLIDQVETEMNRLAAYTGEQTVAGQRQAIETGVTDAHELIHLGSDQAGITASFAKLPTRATESLVSSLHPDAPLTKILNSFGAEAAQKARDVLITGVSTGQGIPVIRANFRAATGTSLSRATTIARTETLRAYRTASLMQYQEAAHLLDGWIWTSTLEEHTCGACLALHNTVHHIDEPFASHVCCRCCPRPQIIGNNVRGISGEEWLSQQPTATQQKILGKAASEAYRAGQVKLADFVAYNENPIWGASVRVASLADAKAARSGEVALTRRLPRPSKNDSAEQVRQKVIDTDRLYMERLVPVQERVEKWSDVADRARTLQETMVASQNLASAQARFDQMQSDRRDRIQALLGAPDPTSFDVQIGRGIGPITERTIQAEAGQVARYLSAEIIVPKTKVEFAPQPQTTFARIGSRSYYDPADSTVKVDRLATNDSGVIAHEMGHVIEAKSPDTLAAALAFYDRRTAGEALVSMNDATGRTDYAPSEMTRVDQFPYAYMGKDFPQRNGTEIITMGLEMLYNEPERLARDDPDYFNFLIKTLHKRQ